MIIKPVSVQQGLILYTLLEDVLLHCVLSFCDSGNIVQVSKLCYMLMDRSWHSRPYVVSYATVTASS